MQIVIEVSDGIYKIRYGGDNLPITVTLTNKDEFVDFVNKLLKEALL